MRTRIDNGSVWLDGGQRSASILIEDERISAILAPDEAVGAEVGAVIDAAGQLVLPGGVDLHVHISDGAESFGPGSRCAAAGGLTTVMDMAPFHACVTPEQFEAKRRQAEAECVVDFGLVAGIVVTMDDLADLAELKRLGSTYFKVFMPGEPPVKADVLWAAVQAAARTGLRLGLHAEETGCLAEVDWADPLGFPRARPPVAETAATAMLLEMARAAGAPVHVCHVSAARTAELVAGAKAAGVDVTAEVTAHFLLLDESEYAAQGPRVKTTPPLRSQADCGALWQALADGTLDALACDHFLGTLAPQPRDPAFTREAEAGIGGLEVSLPLLYHAGVAGGQLSLARFVEVTAEGPAKIGGVWPRKGRIAPGADADLVLIDPAAAWTVAGQGDFSRADTTPFAGWKLAGRVRRTLVRGRTVWDDGRIAVQNGWGKFSPSWS